MDGQRKSVEQLTRELAVAQARISFLERKETRLSRGLNSWDCWQAA